MDTQRMKTPLTIPVTMVAATAQYGDLRQLPCWI